MPRRQRRAAAPGDYIVAGYHRGSFYLYKDGADDEADYWDVLEHVMIGLDYKDEIEWEGIGYSMFYENQRDPKSPRPPKYIWFFSSPQDMGGGRQQSQVRRLAIKDAADFIASGGLLHYGMADFFSRGRQTPLRRSEVNALKNLLKKHG